MTKKGGVEGSVGTKSTHLHAMVALAGIQHHVEDQSHKSQYFVQNQQDHTMTFHRKRRREKRRKNVSTARPQHLLYLLMLKTCHNGEIFLSFFQIKTFLYLHRRRTTRHGRAPPHHHAHTHSSLTSTKKVSSQLKTNPKSPKSKIHSKNVTPKNISSGSKEPRE